MNKAQFQTAVRSTLKLGGLWLVSHHVINDAYLDQILGYGAVIAGLWWSHNEHADDAPPPGGIIATPPPPAPKITPPA